MLRDIDRFSRQINRFLIVALITTTAVACQRSSATGSKTPVMQRLAPQLAKTKDQSVKNAELTYLALFQSEHAAAEHRDAVEARAGDVKVLDSGSTGHRLLQVKISPRDLTNLTIDTATTLSLDTSVQLQHPNTGSDPGAEPMPTGLAATDYLTARKVVGVEDLLARFPTADGRGQKVAVFDTGIDFGLQGVSDNSGDTPKLLGFYDLTGFGTVETTLLDTSAVQPSYNIGSHQLSVAAALAPQAVEATGILSERALAQANLAGDGVDLNGDGADNSEFAFLVGIARDGQRAVWIDIDHNGLIDNRDQEELGDYNSSYRTINLRSDASPSGAYPLAVSIVSPGTVQFHSVGSGHGTSCAVIIAGDGYANGHLIGMAPKAQLLSYTMDRSGQDVYTLSQFLGMFLHAKDQGVDAISISWGFATADLESARFVSTFLDREIASQGIAIAMANGNNGPGIASASAVDYMPHQGFAVGAAITELQARNAYGWTGAVGDHVVFYSSIGPTRGGRAVPDVVSPLITMVRNERGTGSARFYPFSGTSSATPALIGALTALRSAIKQQRPAAAIDMQLLKLAIQATARPLPEDPALYQGAGLINVNAAYDQYWRLWDEKQAAIADAAKRTAFAYDLRASTALQNLPGFGEGLHLRHFVAAARVEVNLTPDSAALIDPLTFAEPVRLVHQGAFFEAPEVITLHGFNGTISGFNIRFKPEIRSAPGIYSDVIAVKRWRDDLTLLRIPVVMEIATQADGGLGLGGHIATTNGLLTPFSIRRQPFTLTSASAVQLDGLVVNSLGTQGARLSISFQDEFGHVAHNEVTAVDQGATALKIMTPILRPGHYELLVMPAFARPGAVLNDVEVTTALRLPVVNIVAAQLQEHSVNLAVRSLVDVTIARAELTIDGHEQSLALALDRTANRPGYYGRLQLPTSLPASKDLSVRLQQGDFEQATERFENVSLAMVDPETQDTLSRGWFDCDLEGGPFSPLNLRRAPEAGQALAVIAYPNIFRADIVSTQVINLDVRSVWREGVVFGQAANIMLRRGAITTLVLENSEAMVADAAVLHGRLSLFDSAGRAVMTALPVRFGL